MKLAQLFFKKIEACVFKTSLLTFSLSTSLLPVLYQYADIHCHSLFKASQWLCVFVSCRRPSSVWTSWTWALSSTSSCVSEWSRLWSAVRSHGTTWASSSFSCCDRDSCQNHSSIKGQFAYPGVRSHLVQCSSERWKGCAAFVDVNNITRPTVLRWCQIAKTPNWQLDCDVDCGDQRVELSKSGCRMCQQLLQLYHSQVLLKMNGKCSFSSQCWIWCERGPIQSSSAWSRLFYSWKFCNTCCSFGSLVSVTLARFPLQHKT